MKTITMNMARVMCLSVLAAAMCACCCNGNNGAAEEEQYDFPEELEDIAFVAPAKAAAAEAVEAADSTLAEAEEAVEEVVNEAEEAVEAAEDAAEEALEAIEELAAEATTEEAPLTLVQVDTKPSFNGGNANDFSKWVNSKLTYPQAALDAQESGRVVLSFVVGKDGRVSNVNVLKSVSETLDAEAVRVVKKSPAWAPAIKDGEPVACTYIFPVNFQLQ